MVRIKFFRSNTADNFLHLHEPLSVDSPSLSQPIFAHANTEPRRWKTSNHHFSLAANKNATDASGNPRAHRHLLSSVLQLFEESVDEHPSYKMKANGAIVINRTYQSSKNHRDNIDLYACPPRGGSACSDYSVSSGASDRGIPSWESEIRGSSEDDEEDEDAAVDHGSFPPTTTPLNPPPRPSHGTKSDIYLDACEALTSSDSKELVDLIFDENQRLREQLARERQEDRTQILKSNDALATARRETRYLRRVLSCTRILIAETAGDKRRRRSTGGATTAAAVKRELGKNSISSFCHTSTMSHERKLKILLDEIEAMQLEDDHLQAKVDQLEKRNAVLKQALWEKDETIRQLRFDIQVETLNR